MPPVDRTEWDAPRLAAGSLTLCLPRHSLGDSQWWVSGSLFAETEFTEYLLNDLVMGCFAYDLAKGL
jgi:hypothetical protein